MAFGSNEPAKPWRSYLEKLNDPLWKKRRLEILAERKEKCEICGKGDRLEIHHGYYAPRRDPWDYPSHTLWCLCRDCHQTTQEKLTSIHAIIGSVHPKELGALKETVGNVTFEMDHGISPAEVAELLEEERRAEAELYKDYSVDLLFSNLNGPSRIDEVEKLADDRFPGLQIVSMENISSRDCVATVSGPDEELRGMIQSWFDKFTN